MPTEMVGPFIPTNYHRHIVGEFREAGWVVSGERPIIRVRCKCAAQHKTFIRSGSVTQEYVRYKLAWLFHETCYAAE